jgi:hypothetical protein
MPLTLMSGIVAATLGQRLEREVLQRLLLRSVVTTSSLEE